MIRHATSSIAEQATASPRRYDSPLRDAAAAATRSRILLAARQVFEQRGWAGARLAGIADRAGVSPKTVQAQFRTKAGLLAATIEFAMRGGTAEDEEPPRIRHVTAQEIRAADSAEQALALHATMVTGIGIRAAALAWVVETAAAADSALVPLWERIRRNLDFGVTWAAETVLRKPGVRPGLAMDDAAAVFALSMASGTYRTLTMGRGMSPEEIESWLFELYRRMLLAPVTPAN